MRHGTSNNRRSRNNKGHGHTGQSNQGGGGQNNGARRGAYNRNQIFDSNGPDVRIRGTAYQVCEKYLALSKDASSVGDIVLAESYLQHAEHYQRIINTWTEDVRDVAARPQPSYNQTEPGNSMQDDELALPASILGGDVKQTSEADVRRAVPQDTDMMESA